LGRRALDLAKDFFNDGELLGAQFVVARVARGDIDGELEFPFGQNEFIPLGVIGN
jgi:hypothetical protein